MSMTFAEMVTMTKRHLDMELSDDDDPKAPAYLIKSMLNFGQTETVRRLGDCMMRKSVFQDATAGAIALPLDFLCGLIVKLKQDDAWRRLNVTPALHMDDKWFSVSAETGRPQVAVLNIGGTGEVSMSLYPELDATITDGLFLSYNWKPTDMSADSDVSAVGAQFPDVEPLLLPAFAAWHIKLFENGVEDEQVGKWKSIYENSLQRIRRAIDGLAVEPSTWMGR